MKLYNNRIWSLKYIVIITTVISVLSACKKLYNLPEDKDYLSENANYNTAPLLKPVMGRTTLFSYFNADNSTFPLTFEIVDFRNLDGTPSDKLNQVKPVLVWKEPYTGLEKSVAEINNKRVLENHPLFEVRSSGEFISWASTTDDNFKKADLIDTAFKFNVKVSNNTGGERILGPLTMAPVKERMYEPSYHINEFTGAPLKEINGVDKRLLPLTLTGMKGASTGRTLTRQNISTSPVSVTQDVWVLFKRVNETGSTLTFKFIDKDGLPINPLLFNGTDWAKLVHGFNPKFGPSSVTYDVAYPIPLTSLRTSYTNSSGTEALVTFSYNRIGFGGLREVGSMSLGFNIYKPGDWEITFRFNNEKPKFQDE